MKSHASDLLELVANVYKDAAAKCAVNPFDLRDLNTIRSRVENEGLSFLTITLPNFGSDFDKSLAEERVAPDLFRMFKKRLRVPVFLQGFLVQIFDQGTGRILHEPAIEAIEGIRQIAYALKKLRITCAPDKVRNAIRQFKQCEHDLEVQLDPETVESFALVSDVLWSNVLARLSCPSSTIPKHGPGSTAERISGNAKYAHRIWHNRLEPYFPLLSFAYSSESAYESEEFEQVSVVNGDKEQPVRVVLVPKTLKGPRVIAIEPVCMQYTQQALSLELTDVLEKSQPTRGHINFRDQTVNRDLALTSSLDRKLATIDLSSASDRVPLSLAMRMFDSVPDFQGAVFACRSRMAQLPGGEILPLSKFASMGSALCFPIEAMYFYTLCIKALLDEQNLPVTFRNICTVGRNVYVYGDDILVPTNKAEAVTATLQKYYCKVSIPKSYWKGSFRESCGMDAFAGEEVTPLYVRQLQPRNRRDYTALISWTKTSNLFYRKGYWATADYLAKVVERYLGKLPIVAPECGCLGRESFQARISVERWNTRYHAFEVKAWVPKPVYQNDKLAGHSALTKSLLELERASGEMLSRDKQHLVRSARYGAVTLKRRWTRPC